MYCNHCGAKIVGDAQFCAQCGHPVKKTQRFSAPPTHLGDDRDETLVISSQEIQEALKKSASDQAQRPPQPAPMSPNPKSAPVQAPKEVRPAWLDEEDDPALFANLPAGDKVGTPKKEAKASKGSQLGSVWKQFRDKMDQDRDARQAKKAQISQEKPQAPQSAETGPGPKKDFLAKFAKGKDKGGTSPHVAKDRKPLFESLSSGQDSASDTFIYLYVAVISIALVIGVVLGLFILRPWASNKDDQADPGAQASTGIVWQQPQVSGFLLKH